MKITTYCKKCGVARVFSCRAEEKRKNKTGYCRECFLENTPKMSDSPSWNGGTFIRSGYRFIKIPDHPFANNLGYVREHRLVMEKFLGRYLTPKEVVHHKDGNKLNNSVENLAIMDNREHPHTHAPKKRYCTLCEKKHLARGFCKKHYRQFMKNTFGVVC